MKAPLLRALFTISILITLPGLGRSHCDTMEGPVVADALRAIEQGDPTPVLKWVRQEDEVEIRAAFSQTLAVRALDESARDLADRYFLETLVRIHRASEHEPYSGIKPAGSPIDPAVILADRSLQSGDADELVRALTSAMEKGLRTRFQEARETKAVAEENVEQGRAYVAAYVQFTHYVERLHQTAATEQAHGTGSSPHAAHH